MLLTLVHLHVEFGLFPKIGQLTMVPQFCLDALDQALQAIASLKYEEVYFARQKAIMDTQKL